MNTVLGLLIAWGLVLPQFVKVSKDTGPRLAIGESGIVTVNVSGRTPFRVDALAEALPGFTIEAGTAMTEGESFDSFEAHLNGEPALQIYADETGSNVGIIVVVGTAIEGPDGLRVGTLFRDMPSKDALECVPGMEELSGHVICSRRGTSRLRYVFEPIRWEGPDDVLPEPSALDASPLQQIAWSVR